MQSTKMTDREAIAKVMLIRDDIRNYNTEKYADISNEERIEYMDALSILINIAIKQAESSKLNSEKTGLDLFAEILAERRIKEHE